MTNPAFHDAFNLLCGEKIGSGVYRDVFACRIRPDCVVKVEIQETWRSFCNVLESRFWSDHEHNAAVSKWLAPVVFTSPDGLVTLQRRAEPLTGPLPPEMPEFLTDLKRANFGILDGRIVCVDYAFQNVRTSTRMRKVQWAGEE